MKQLKLHLKPLHGVKEGLGLGQCEGNQVSVPRSRPSFPGGCPPTLRGQLLDRLLHHAHVLKCDPRSWRTKLHSDLRQGDEVNLHPVSDATPVWWPDLTRPRVAGFEVSTEVECPSHSELRIGSLPRPS